jgi:hypothetical protein
MPHLLADPHACAQERLHRINARQMVRRRAKAAHQRRGVTTRSEEGHHGLPRKAGRAREGRRVLPCGSQTVRSVALAINLLKGFGIERIG